MKSEQLLQFIHKAKSPFHAVAEVKHFLNQHGFVELKETEDYQIQAGGNYYVVRNDSSMIAFRVPKKEMTGFHMVAVHSDSPTFKVKEQPEMKTENYIRLNTEPYGGMIMNSWFDRPLSVAGRISMMEDGNVVTKLVDVDEDLLVIPNVAIHMNREINSGMKYDASVDVVPLFGDKNGTHTFLQKVAKSAGTEASEILSYDLFLYVREQGRIIGANKEYVLSPKLDDLQCVFSAMEGFADSTPEEKMSMLLIFDNEEVGSTTRQGADSTFLPDTLLRIQESLGKSSSWMKKMLAGSFLISADNAHAVHPNHPEYADFGNRPYLNEGIVLKYHGGQKYTSDAYSAGTVKALCKRAGVPYQIFTNKSNKVGGSTLGNLLQAQISVASADIGLAQLAMHSAVETAGAKDTEYAIKMFQTFYQE